MAAPLAPVASSHTWLRRRTGPAESWTGVVPITPPGPGPRSRAHNLRPGRDCLRLGRWRDAAVFLVRLRNGRYYPATGAVVTDDGHLLADLSPAYPPPRLLRDHPALAAPPPARVRAFGGRGVLLSTPYASHNYFHWMFDLVPRIRLLALAGESVRDFDHVFVNRTTHPFQRETLAAAGVPPRAVVETDGCDGVACAELCVPSPPSRMGFPPRWAVEFVDGLFPPAAAAPGPRGTAIFLDRADAASRRLLNRDEVVAAVRAAGFDVRTAAELPVAAQAALCRGARSVVGLHGAGLTNVAFASPAARVLELFPDGTEKRMYWCICRAKGIDYSYAHARPGDTDPDGNVAWDATDLRRLLDRWLAGSRVHPSGA